MIPAMALALLAAQAELPPVSKAQPVEAPADACSGKLYTQFDFWLGNWNVFTRAGGEQIATSKVEKINGNCALRQSWVPVKGAPGGTLTAPDMLTARWHQYWTDSLGNKVDLEGGLAFGNMILAGEWRGAGGKEAKMLRVTYTRLDADSVRQLGEVSDDEGLTWQVTHDYLYLRAKPAD